VVSSHAFVVNGVVVVFADHLLYLLPHSTPPTISFKSPEEVAAEAEAALALSTVKLKGLADLNGSITAELNELRSELTEARRHGNRAMATGMASEAAVMAARAELEGLRKRFDHSGEDLAMAEQVHNWNDDDDDGPGVFVDVVVVV
jgi:hypothetical protein